MLFLIIELPANPQGLNVDMPLITSALCRLVPLSEGRIETDGTLQVSA